MRISVNYLPFQPQSWIMLMHKKGSVGGSAAAVEQRRLGPEISPFLTLMLIVKVMKGETDLTINCDTHPHRGSDHVFTSVFLLFTHTYNLA